MIAGQRHLRGTDQVQLVVGEPVDLGGVRAEEAGALHHLGAHQRGRDHRREPGRVGLRHGEVHQREFELRADAGEEVEPGAGDLGTPVGVDGAQRRADLRVLPRVLDLRRRADRLEGDEVVLAAGRDAVLHDVGQRQVRPAQRRLGVGLLGLGGPDLGGQLLRAGQHGGALVGRGLRHGAADGASARPAARPPAPRRPGAPRRPRAGCPRAPRRRRAAAATRAPARDRRAPA